MLATDRKETIRHATGEDYEQILDCLMKFARSMAYRMIPSSSEYLSNPRPYMGAWITRQFERVPTAMFVAEDDGRLIGICAGSIVDFPLVPDFPHLREWAWWVEGESRTGRTGVALFHALKAWAKKHGARGCVWGEPKEGTETTMTETLHWRIW